MHTPRSYLCFFSPQLDLPAPNRPPGLWLFRAATKRESREHQMSKCAKENCYTRGQYTRRKKYGTNERGRPSHHPRSSLHAVRATRGQAGAPRLALPRPTAPPSAHHMHPHQHHQSAPGAPRTHASQQGHGPKAAVPQDRQNGMERRVPSPSSDVAATAPPFCSCLPNAQGWAPCTASQFTAAQLPSSPAQLRR